MDNHGITINDDQDIADTLNDHFVSVGSIIAKKIENTTITSSFDEYNITNTMLLKETNRKEVLEVIEELNQKSAAGHDNIRVKDILLLKDILTPILVKLANQSFTEGKFPTILKTSRITPIHKSGCKSSVDNYRPISVIDVLSKILEILFKKRLLEHLEKSVKYDDFQYGFQSRSGTLNASMDLMDHISTNVDKGYYTLAVSIDLRKAFDVVDQKVLLDKLEKMGLRDTTLKYIRSYLEDREQYTEVNGVQSKPSKINYGVPQGSILGPLLFLTYIRSLELAGLKGRYFLYADDMLLVYKEKSLEILEQEVNCDLHKYHEWLIHNKLQINTKKTLTLYSPKRMSMFKTWK